MQMLQSLLGNTNTRSPPAASDSSSGGGGGGRSGGGGGGGGSGMETAGAQRRQGNGKGKARPADGNTTWQTAGVNWINSDPNAKTWSAVHAAAATGHVDTSVSWLQLLWLS